MATPKNTKEDGGDAQDSCFRPNGWNMLYPNLTISIVQVLEKEIEDGFLQVGGRGFRDINLLP